MRRMYAAGYRYGEVKLAEIGPVKEGTRFSMSGYLPDPTRRPPVLVSLGCHVDGAALPRPDLFDRDTAIAGVRKRFAFAPPRADQARLERLQLFVRQWVRDHLRPLAPEADVSFETWIAGTDYPDWRKQQLRDCWTKLGSAARLTVRHYACKSFIKDESYSEFKHARGINSRTDEFKCAVGPIFKAIEREVFKLPQFIKHVPVADRPKYIKDRLSRGGGRLFATDYTSFESLFVPELMTAVEFELYDYMTQALPDHEDFMWLCRNVIGGVQQCHFRGFTATVPGCRMSGEMCTSLGNGFSNLMFALFLARELGIPDLDGVVEGDDGLFVAGRFPTSEDFATLGLVIKIEEHNTFSEASFCGLVFDSNELINVTDVIDTVVGFGWTYGCYARCSTKRNLMLLRCKALSLAHQYPGCPVIQELAKYGLRVTTGVRNYIRSWVKKSGPRGMSMWEREQLLAAMRDERKLKFPTPGPATRLLVERLYGVSVEEQVSLESYFGKLSTLTAFRHHALLNHTRPAWRKYWDEYVFESHTKSPNLERFPIHTGCYPGFMKEWR